MLSSPHVLSLTHQVWHEAKKTETGEENTLTPELKMLPHLKEIYIDTVESFTALQKDYYYAAMQKEWNIVSVTPPTAVHCILQIKQTFLQL